MNKKSEESTFNENELRPDCKNCFAFCCTALYFSASEGFPQNKPAGKPCINLQPDFSCRVHENLSELGLKGCLAFDCFGAGQKVARISFGGRDWLKEPHKAEQMFEVFLIMRQLHELLWYLSESLKWQETGSLHTQLRSILDNIRRLTELSPDLLINLDLNIHREKVNYLLLKVSELVRAEFRQGQKAAVGRRIHTGKGADLTGKDLREMDLKGINLRGAYLMASVLRGCDLAGTDMIGADLRDADLRGADLSSSLFLTQAQINAAIGDKNTKLPPSLDRPAHWHISDK